MSCVLVRYLTGTDIGCKNVVLSDLFYKPLSKKQYISLYDTFQLSIAVTFSSNLIKKWTIAAQLSGELEKVQNGCISLGLRWY